MNRHDALDTYNVMDNGLWVEGMARDVADYVINEILPLYVMEQNNKNVDGEYMLALTRTYNVLKKCGNVMVKVEYRDKPIVSQYTFFQKIMP